MVWYSSEQCFLSSLLLGWTCLGEWHYRLFSWHCGNQHHHGEVKHWLCSSFASQDQVQSAFSVSLQSYLFGHPLPVQFLKREISACLSWPLPCSSTPLSDWLRSSRQHVLQVFSGLQSCSYSHLYLPSAAVPRHWLCIAPGKSLQAAGSDWCLMTYSLPTLLVSKFVSEAQSFGRLLTDIARGKSRSLTLSEGQRQVLGGVPCSHCFAKGCPSCLHPSLRRSRPVASHLLARVEQPLPSV